MSSGMFSMEVAANRKPNFPTSPKLGEHVRYWQAVEWKSIFSVLQWSQKWEQIFFLVSVSLSFRRVWISLPIRSFWKPRHFLNLFYSIIHLILSYPLLTPTTFQNKERKFSLQVGGKDTRTNQELDATETKQFWSKIWKRKTITEIVKE